MRQSYTNEFLRAIPKTDLHVHLDGSLRVPTLIELAREQGVKLPSYSVAGLNERVFKRRYTNLVEYLQGFRYTTAVMQTAEALERIAYEFAWDNFNEGVRYFEVRFAPQLHINERLRIEDVMLSVNRGLQRAVKEYNRRPEVVNDSEPPVACGIIACAMRAIFKGMSAYYDQFLEVHRFTRNKRVIGLASLELVQAMVHVRDELGVPVVGLDIAGPERGYPPDDHQEAIAIAHRHFFMKTVHAGEAYGPESIFQAITLLHADRIGHGYYLFSANMVKDLPPRRAALYIRNLVQYIADRRITIEVCLTSNMQTNPTLRDLRKHSFSKMMQERLSTTLCTDNHTVSKTNITQELRLACQTFDLSPRELRDIIVYGFKRSFFPGTYRQKRSYVRRIIDYYDSVVARYNHGTRPAKP